jgi:hypothetical protein
MPVTVAINDFSHYAVSEKEDLAGGSRHFGARL